MPDQLDAIWKAICDKVRERVSPDTFRRWFSSTRLAEADEERLLLKIPNNIYGLWIDSNYLAILKHAVTEVLGHPRKIEYVYGGKDGSAEAMLDFEDSALEEPPEESKAAREMAPELSTSRVVAPKPAGGLSESLEKAIKRAGLNRQYRFDTFVISDSTNLAAAASLAVSRGGDRRYNPLFIWGGPGLGKTHLMHAIGNEHLRLNPRAKVVYVTCEVFTNEFIDSLQNNRLGKFRDKYRRADVLLVDDIHFLAGKEKSQEEFFHTFNTICDGEGQIVLSSDRSANDIPDLEDRIVSRCEWGMSAGLELPSVETRLAILRKKMEMWDVELADHIVEFLADRIRRSVRRLEGAMMRLASYASLSGKALTDDVIEGLLKDILREEGKCQITVDLIIKEVGENYSVPEEDLRSRKRTAKIAFARQVAMYLSRVLTRHSLVEIGREFGRDHGTVIHAVRKVESRMEEDSEIRRRNNSLITRLSRY